MDTLQRRITLTTSLRTTDALPKVPDAGSLQRRHGVDVQVMHNGVIVEKDCYYGAWMTGVIADLRGHHEPQEEIAFDCLLRCLRETATPVMVELGSYWAYYSLWFKTALADATVVMAEPDPRNLRVGQRNFDLNGLSGRWVEAAIGREHGARLRLRCESDGVVRPVRVVTLDGLMEDEELPRVDLVLCDVQGSELDMLAGAVNVIRAGRVRFMLISTHWFADRPLIHQECLAMIERFGGHVMGDHSIPESCSGDGLVVASFDPRDAGSVLDIATVRARDSLLGELEWHLARRVGWRGVVHGLVDMLPASLKGALEASRVGAVVRRRLFGRRALVTSAGPAAVARARSESQAAAGRVSSGP